mgnify:CR=1 FL=1
MIKTITPIDNTIYVERDYNSKIIEETISNSVIAQNEWGSLKVEERVDLLKKFVESRIYVFFKPGRENVFNLFTNHLS